jgi:hypothetical protein
MFFCVGAVFTNVLIEINLLCENAIPNTIELKF